MIGKMGERFILILVACRCGTKASNWRALVALE
jgi:hypothetical protein